MTTSTRLQAPAATLTPGKEGLASPLIYCLNFHDVHFFFGRLFSGINYYTGTLSLNVFVSTSK